MRVLSLATWPALPRARAMAQSLRERHPEWEVTVAVLRTRSRPLPVDECFRALDADELVDADVGSLVELHEPEDLVALLTPRLLRWALRNDDAPLLYLAPTVWVCDGLDLLREAAERDPVTLVPRVSHDLPADELRPTPLDLAEHGRLTTACLALGGTDPARRFVEWWAERVWDVLQPPAGKLSAATHRTDRGLAHRFLELAPALFGARVLDDPGCNLSAWNLHEHSLRPDGARIVVDAETPLRFLDLPGFEPDRPWRLHPDADRVRVSESPVLHELLAGYASQLLAAGWQDFDHHRDVGARLANGMLFDERMRRLLAEALASGEDFGDVFDAAGGDALMAWLRAPARRGAGAGISRYLYRVYRDRPDLPLAYPDLDGPGGDEFAAWCWVFGRAEMDIPRELLPPPPEQLDHEGQDRGVEVGVRVSGYLGHTLGLGSAARGYVAALGAAGVPVSTLTVPLSHLELPSELASGYGEHGFDELEAAADEVYELVCVNPDELRLFAQRVGAEFFSRRATIGVWGWETNAIPARWASAFELVDEIWVYSRYMAENLARVAPVPVVCLPPPVATPQPSGGDLRLGVGEGYLFLFLFDYMSTIERKNPVGLIEAFKLAFSPGEGPQLLVKTLNGPLRPQAVEAVLWAAAGRPDVHVVDCSLSAGEKDALIASCDCYVSLHRAEGFGLTLAEAMALGKPVIGTAYSGNMDFMTPGNSYPVDYRLVRVGAESKIYPAEGEWADPNLDHAARLLRHVWEDPAGAAQVGERAREDVRTALSAGATGQAMRRRLESLTQRSGRRAPAPAS